jgi:hypothetical protein
VSRSKCETRFASIPKKHIPALMAALKEDIAGWNDPKFIPMPYTWLNQKRYLDEPVVIRDEKPTMTDSDLVTLPIAEFIVRDRTRERDSWDRQKLTHKHRFSCDPPYNACRFSDSKRPKVLTVEQIMSSQSR